MKIVVFGAQRRVGVWDGNQVVDINSAATEYFSIQMSRSEAVARAARDAPANLEQFIAAGKPALELARTATAEVKGSDDGSLVQPIASVRLHAPWPGRRVFCAGANFALHGVNLLTNMGKKTSRKEVEDEMRQFEPIGFCKTVLDAAGPDSDVMYPARTTQLDYEGEVAVIIGKRAKDIPASEARNYVWGVTLANDWSDRVAPWPRFPLSFNLQKNFDDCLSMGPCVVVGDDSDLHNMSLTLQVNGEIRQEFNTDEMVYSFYDYIAYLSRDMTLVPGDVLLGGTGAGTAMDLTKRAPGGSFVNLDLFLKVGDVVELKSPKIGCLRNRIVAKH